LGWRCGDREEDEEDEDDEDESSPDLTDSGEIGRDKPTASCSDEQTMLTPRFNSTPCLLDEDDDGGGEFSFDDDVSSCMAPDGRRSRYSGGDQLFRLDDNAGRVSSFFFNAILMYRLFWFSLSPQKQKGAVLGSPKRCVKVGQGGGQQTKVAGGKKKKEEKE